MRSHLTILLVLSCLLGATHQVMAQSDTTKLTIRSTERTDWVDYDVEPPAFPERVQATRVTYTCPSSSNTCSTRKYVVDDWNSQYGGINPKKDTLVRKIKRWKRSVPRTTVDQLIANLHTNVDSLPVKNLFLHTSHHYLYIHVSLIEQGDTSRWWKSKPFNAMAWACSGDNRKSRLRITPYI